MRSCKLTTKFQTTIPREIREKLNLKAGDRVNFEIHETGHVVVKKAQFIEPEVPKINIQHEEQAPVVPQLANDDWTE